MSRILQPNIVAVIVTYNRLQQLQIIIESLNRQTVSLNGIIVVDNDSKDGTESWLQSRNKITSIRQKNSGGAGGFKTGVAKAIESNADWIWLLDDDVMPEDNCLEQLLKYSNHSKCIQPIRFGLKDQMLDEERIMDVNRASIISFHNQSFKNGKDYIFTNIGCFEGMLIHKEIVLKIGLPDERFFLAHDDLIYGYLANKYTNNLITQKAILRKLPSAFLPYDSLNYLYYSMRNLWLVNEYLSKDELQYENYRKKSIKIEYLRQAYIIIKSYYFQSKWKAIKTLFKAYRDYKNRKSGKTFNV